MTIDNSEYSFLKGGGEMGLLIRAKDWSKTPLGNPSTWPSSLKTMVGVMLENPYGTYIAWGKEFTQIYNDGYRPILGENKHPYALGSSTKESFSEVWDFADPLFDEVMNGKAMFYKNHMLTLNRNDYLEQCYFDFAYSPIRLENGEVGGVLVTISETTTSVQAEKHLKHSKEELEFVIEASQLGTFDYNPVSNEFSANPRLKKWFGLPDTENMDLSYGIAAIAPQDRVRVEQAINESLNYDSQQTYDIEFAIIPPTSKKEMIVHAKGQAWFDDNKTAYRLNGTVEDVTNRVTARKKIEENERSLRMMVLKAPVAIAIFKEPEHKVEVVNEYCLRLWGKTEEDVLHKSIFESLPELKAQGLQEIMDTVYSTGVRYENPEFGINFIREDISETLYINFSFEPMFDAKNKINGIMVIGYDITPQVMARREIEKSEQNMRALVESAPFPIGVFVGEEMRITLANQSIIDAWDRDSDVIGKTYTEVLPELENQSIYEQILGVLKTGIPYHAKEQKVNLLTHGKLQTYYFNYSFTPLLDASGNVYAVMNTAVDLTQLVEAKYKIEESEKRFRNTVKQAAFGIVIFRGPNHIAELANDTYLQLIDRKEQEFIGRPLFESVPEVIDKVKPIFDNIYKTGEAFHGYEFSIPLNRHGSTEICYFNFVYQPLKEMDEITGIMVVATEVTATVKARHLIEENEEKLNLIIDASQMGMFELDVQTLKINVSSRCQEILGFSKSKNIDQSEFINLIHPKDLPRRNETMKKAFASGILEQQLRVKGSNGYNWIDIKGKIFYDDDQNPLRVLGTIRDISEEMNFQNELMDREAKFRLLADSMPQQVWTADPDGYSNYFNKTVLDYSGLTLQQLLKTGWLDMVHPDDRKENIEKWSHSVKTGEEFLLEHRFRKHNGEYRWQLSRAQPQKDKNGKTKMWVGSSTDIQKQKMFTYELENMVKLRTKELEQKNIDLENMNKELQSFVYISSHDLQEPLRKIQTFSSRILETEYEQLSDTAKRHFGRMQNSAFRMQTLIQDLIAYSRTSAQEIKFESVDLNAIIEDVRESLSEELEQNKVNLKLHNICEVRIIPVQFKQVLHNLISNSIKFARESTPLIIEINCEIIEGKNLDFEPGFTDIKYCHINYTDNGIGFESEYNSKIFEVFQRLHNKDEYTGTGIGLAIVKRIIENHKGIITATGQLGEGAVFDIYIPTV